MSLSPSTVFAGVSSTVTVALDRPSLSGDVTLDLLCGAPGFATLPVPPQLTIGQGQISQHVHHHHNNTEPAGVPDRAGLDRRDLPVSHRSRDVRVSDVERAIVGCGGNTQDAHVVPGNGDRRQSKRGDGDSHPGRAGGDGGRTRRAGAVEWGRPAAARRQRLHHCELPPSITIPAGQTSGHFTITTNVNVTPGTKRNVTIMAGAVQTQTATLIVTA